jgi:erythromycin esterase
MITPALCHWRTLLGLLAFIICFAADSPTAADDPPYLNLDFESKGYIKRWYVGGDGYEGTIDTVTVHSGKQSLRLRKVHEPSTAQAFGVATGSFPTADVAGKSIRYTGYIKTEGVSDGRAGLWWRVDTPDGVGAFDNMMMRPIQGDTDWARYEINLDVDSTVNNINFGVILTGKGTAWYDSLNVYVNGEHYPQLGEESYEPTPEAVAWVRVHAFPFDTVVPGSGFDDLSAVRELVGDARIVALGEVTHGSRDIFQMKHRIFEYLAENMGFRVFAIEASMPETYRMNDYVLEGEGDPAEILVGMYFWTWNTQEVLDFAKWMRSYNESGKGPLQFVGFDMQAPNLARETVEEFLDEHDSEAKENLAVRLSVLAEYDDKQKRREAYQGNISQEEKDRIGIASETIYLYLKGEQHRYLETLPADSVDWVIQNARVLDQATKSMILRSPGFRDSCMAENVQWILDHNPDEKIVLWAHNFHVSRFKNGVGSFLDKHYGDDMAVFGFGFHEGEFTAISKEGGVLTVHEATPSQPGSVEYLMHQAGIPRFFLDLRGISKDSPAAPWFLESREMRSIGAVAVAYGFSPAIASDGYDVLIYLDETEATHCLAEKFAPGSED